MKVSGRIGGLQELFGALDALKKGVRTRVLRQCVNAGSTPILQAARAHVPTRTKLLKKSLGKKTRTYGNGNVVVVIGPRTGFKQQVGVRKRAGKRSKAGTPVYEDPAKIAHLVEYGHGGPHPAPAHPFLRPAFDETKAEAKARMIQVGMAGVEAEARKAAKP